MSITEAISSVFHNYANFSGRARRAEYWYWTLFVAVVGAILSSCAGFMNGGDGGANIFTILSSIFSLATFIPSLAVSWRRLHDIGRSGGWFFIGLIPVIGWIPLLIWYCKDGEPGENQYGPSPKY